MAEEATPMVIASRVREVVRAADMNMAGDFVDALGGEVKALVEKACKRAQENGRKTVRGTDL